MTTSPNSPLASEIMSFLEQIEMSFQDAEQFLQASQSFLDQKEYGSELAATIQQIKMAKTYVSKLRLRLPERLDEQEELFLEALRKTRAQRRYS